MNSILYMNPRRTGWFSMAGLPMMITSMKSCKSTDGSYNGTTSSWAFAIVLVDTTGQPHLFGYAAAQLELQQGEHGYAGTLKHGAMEAEIEALHWSSWWALRYVYSMQWKGRVRFRWDSKTAGNKAKGEYFYMPTLQQGCTALRLRNFQQALHRLLPTGALLHEHIYAHAGEPINELVDQASKKANEGDWKIHLGFPKPTVLEIVASKCFEMLWYYVSQGKDDGLPRYADGEMTWTSHRQSTASDETTVQNIASSLNPFKSKLSEIRKELHYEMKFATYNALSLGDGMPKQKTITSETGRVALLRQQACRLGLHIVAIQEARSQKGVTSPKTHFRFASGCTQQKTHGVELWFSKDLPFATSGTSGSHFFKDYNFHVLHAEHDRLIVQYSSDELNLTIAALHAPHNGHPHKQRDGGG